MTDYAPDQIDDLVRRSATDPGAPFEPGALQLLADLKQANLAEFERFRARLSKYRVRLPALDREIERLIKNQSPPPLSLTLNDVEPWPDEVDGAQLLDEIVAAVGRHLVVEEPSKVALALWTVFTHAHDYFSVSPRLALISPVKRCGKTRAAELVSRLVLRPQLSSNLTPAVIYRVIEADKPTLIIDEADTFFDLSSAMRGILNSGHTRAAARVLRASGDKFEVKSFSTWAPVVIALIGMLPDTLADRSILIAMRRKLPDQEVEELTHGDINVGLDQLRRKIARWVADHAHDLATFNGNRNVPKPLDARAADNWRPLLAIADLVGGDWPDRARQAAVALSGDRENASNEEQLLADIRDLFAAEKTDRLSSKAICDALAKIEGRPWADWQRGQPISPNQVARLLRPFRIQPLTVRLSSEGTAKGYRRGDFDRAFEAYLPPMSVTPSQPTDAGGDGLVLRGLDRHLRSPRLDDFTYGDGVTDQQADLDSDDARDRHLSEIEPDQSDSEVDDARDTYLSEIEPDQDDPERDDGQPVP